MILRKFLLIFIASTSLIFATSKENYFLKIEDKTNNVLYEYLLPDNEFIIGYTHSVMKTLAEEVFIPTKKNEINLIKTIYSSYGVGLPFLPEEGEMEIIDGRFHLNINRTFKDLTFGVSEISKHFLKIGGKTYFFTEILKSTPAKIYLTINKKNKFKGGKNGEHR